MNSIRRSNRASLLGDGEACRMSGERLAAQHCQGLERGRFGCGWSGNDRKGTWDKWRDLLGRQERGPAGVRASIRARKPGNVGGAKRCRKTKGSESAYRTDHSADCRKARTRRAQRASGTRQTALENSPVTGRWHIRWSPCDAWANPLSGLGSIEVISPLRRLLVNWRVPTRQRSARTVRWEGRVPFPSLPQS